MMITGSRNVIRALTTTGTDIPKALITTVSRPKRRRKGRTSSAKGIQSSVDPRDAFNTAATHAITEGKHISSFASVCDAFRTSSTPDEYAAIPYALNVTEALGWLMQQEVLVTACSKQSLPVDPINCDQLTPRLRDETLASLWCLHSAFYSLSSVVFCKAVCLMDLFITKVKVKPKYAMCVASACYYVASKFEREQDVLLPTVDSLVMLSRCGGTSADLTRMVEILLSKLTPATVAKIGACQATAADFLGTFIRLYEISLVAHTSTETGPQQNKPRSLSTFITRQLELALVHSGTTHFRPSCIALALLSLYCSPSIFADCTSEIGADVTPQFRLCDLFTLAHVCRLAWNDVEACKAVLLEALAPTNNPRDVAGHSTDLLGHSPPLVWTLSRRTQRSISTSSPPGLPTIDEEVDEKLSHADLDMARLSIAPTTHRLCGQRPCHEKSTSNGR